MKKIIPLLVLLFLSSLLSAQTTRQETKKIATFCKVWGFLKYYHPQVAKGKFDWDKEFTTRVNVLPTLKTKQEISNYYLQWINSLGEVKQCKKCQDSISNSTMVNLDLAWLSDTTLFTGKLIDKLHYIKENRNQGTNYYIYPKERGMMSNCENEKLYKDSVFPSTQMRLLALARYWNIINYFSPNKYIIGQDWNRVLPEMIPTFINVKDTTAYHFAMLELISKTNDDHAEVLAAHSDFYGSKWAPFDIKIIDHKAIVTSFYNDSLCHINDIRVGDVFLTINGESIADIIHKESKYVASSNKVLKLRDLAFVMFRGWTDTINTTFDRSGTILKKQIYRYAFKDLHYDGPPHKAPLVDTYKILDGNIGYINMGVLQHGQVRAVMQKLKNTQAIIIDIRNYPSNTNYLLADLLDQGQHTFAKFTYPDMSYPGVFLYTHDVKCGKKKATGYQGKIVLLFNEDTQSHAEFTVMALQTAPNVICIGSHTAGADGNVTLIPFPGGFKTYMTGLGVYYPDGRQTQRVGITPDIVAKPTIASIRAGKDVLLEKALDVIHNKQTVYKHPAK